MVIHFFFILVLDWGVNVRVYAPTILPLNQEPPLVAVKEPGCLPEPFWRIWRCEKNFSPSGNEITVSRKSISQISYCTDNAIHAPTLLHVSLVIFLEVDVYFLDFYYYLEHLIF
jgi:hypothetical protein